MQKMIDAAEAYIRNLYDGNSDGHGYDHSLRVYRNAMMIAETKPEADRFIVAMAALLHDADDSKLFATENNFNARRFLEMQGVDISMTDQICETVNAVSFSKNRGKRPASIEGQIVQDADRLDAIGAVGIARTFAFGGGHGREMTDSIQHFHEKLLLLKDLMSTEKGKELAEERHAFMIGFLAEWDRETRGV